MSGHRVWVVGGPEDGLEVDTVVWCTGYTKQMDFLNPSAGMTVSEEGHVLEPLYMHYININYPTMAVMNVNPANVPFRQMDLQVGEVLVKSW